MDFPQCIQNSCFYRFFFVILAFFHFFINQSSAIHVIVIVYLVALEILIINKTNIVLTIRKLKDN